MLVGAGFAFSLGRAVRRRPGGRQPARHADRLLVRRARRPDHRHQRRRPQPALRALRRRRSSSPSAATPGSSRASPAATRRSRSPRRPPSAALVEGAQVAFSGIFASAIQVAAPVLIAVVLCDVAFGLVNRVVPQLNVFAVGFPAKVTIGLVLVGASLPFVAGWLVRRAAGLGRRRAADAEGGRLAMAENKTEKATPKKRQEARQKGQVARSMDAQRRRRADGLGARPVRVRPEHAAPDAGGDARRARLGRDARRRLQQGRRPSCSRPSAVHVALAAARPW